MPIPTDPLLASQWHLNNSVAGLLDLNVFGVWNPAMGPAYTGAGTRTLVIDDGFDYTHSDFDNYDQGLDFDFDALDNGSNGNNDFDPFGNAGDAHGTAVAGIIGANDDGTGAVGVAYNTSLVGYRTHGFITDGWLQDIRDSIAFGATNAQADVANISQGIANDAASEFGVGYNALRFDEIETAIGTAVNTGRGGLGMSIVKSAGNSRADAYDVNADDWTNDTRQIVVAAVDQNGFISSYSSYGAANLVSGFGTPIAGQVVTTDRVGGAGYNGTDFTSGFNGTSAAAPMVTGVVSLMYDANAGLGWRDVQSILASSARHVGSAVGGGIAGSEKYAWDFNAAGTWNGGGQHFSNDYGYGLVDALAAVRLAETWLLGGVTTAATTANQFTNTMDVLNAATVIPDGNAAGLNFVGNAVFDDIVERVTVQMSFSTTFTGDLNIYLTSPDGTVSRLIDSAGGGNDYNGTWTFESQAFRGERAAGNWTVRVVDDAGSDVLTVTDIVIRTFGAATANDRYVMTNEFSNYAGIFGHATNINDANGGIDTVNAAAVSSASTIRLDGVAGSIDGVGVIFTNIENAIGGDGGDSITGNGDANSLWGMRGNDTINGGAGVDNMYGGYGDDILNGGSGTDNAYGEEGNDFFRHTGGDFGANSYGGAGTDTLDLSGWTNAAIAFNVDLAAQNYQFLPNAFGVNGTYDAQSIENVTGSDFNDTITGDGVANVLKGGGGADTILGGGGVDNLFGDAGDDILNGGLFKDNSYGGTGDDTFKITGADFADNVYGGTETDTLDLSGWTNAAIAFNVNLATQNYQLLPNDFGLNGTYDAQSIENVIGSNFNDTIIGDGNSNDIDGGGGDDQINGGAGLDTMRGGLGNDNYYVDNAGDTTDETGGGGIGDYVLTTVSFTAAAGIERLYLQGAGNINAIGRDAQVDFLLGNSGNNGLDGKSGADLMRGGLGNDNYYVDNIADVTDETIGGGGVLDQVFATVSYTAAAGIERLTLQGAANINATGRDAQADFLIGNSGNNVLDGKSGIDTMRGGLGNDTYYVDNIADVTDETIGGGGIGDYVFSSVSFTAAAGIERLYLQGAANINATGRDGQADFLLGNSGNNVLDGKSGVDVMRGGLGNDTYYVDNAADVTDETIGGGGIGDYVFSSVSFTAAAGIERLYLQGAGNINATGRDGQVDHLIGNAGNNILNGKGGNDNLQGGLGQDTYRFDTLLGAGNLDQIIGFSSVDDKIELDNAVFIALGAAVGPLAASMFQIGAAANDVFDRIIYNNATGALLYDADGNTGGGVAAIQFATLAGAPVLALGDLFVI